MPAGWLKGRHIADPQSPAHRQVHVAEACSDHPRPARTVKFEDALEVAEKFRQAHCQKILRAPLCCRLLFFVGIAIAERVMGVEDLRVEIEDGELQLMGPQPAWFIRRRETQSRAQEQQDIRRLRDELRAGLEDRRGKWRARDVSAFEYSQNCGHAAALRLWQDGHIDVAGAGFFQREAYEFTASLDARPVIELVGHKRFSPGAEPKQCGTRPTRESGAAVTCYVRALTYWTVLAA